MLKFREFSHNHHPSGVKMLAKYIRRGILGINIFSEIRMGEKNGKTDLIMEKSFPRHAVH